MAKCFDCALYNRVMFETASPAVYKPYYEQIDWRNRDVRQSSLTRRALGVEPHAVWRRRRERAL